MRGLVRIGLVAAVPALAAGALRTADAEVPAVVSESESARFALPDVLPVVDEVKDPVFAILVGLVRSDSYGSLSREHLERELRRRPGRSRLPYQRLKELRRLPGAQGETALVSAQFNGPLDMAIPYSILWYHPGKLSATPTCVFREWMLGSVHVPRTGGPPVALEDLHLFGLSEGRLRVDIDWWLDRLLGGALDDTAVTGALVFRYHSRWLGMAVGYNDRQNGRSGAFDLGADRVVFPVPVELRAVGRQMRERMESLLGAPGRVIIETK